MPQFYPDGPATVNLNAINENGGITVPPEPPGEFDTPGMQGSMQQLLSENLGKFIIADFLVGVSSIVRRAGILYSVGRGFLVIYQEDYHTFQVCDIFSLKFVSFFPPGFEPSLDELLAGDFASGILLPGGGLGAMFGANNTEPRTEGQSYTARTAGGAMPRSGSGSPSGCRTLGQR